MVPLKLLWKKTDTIERNSNSITVRTSQCRNRYMCNYGSINGSSQKGYRGLEWCHPHMSGSVSRAQERGWKGWRQKEQNSRSRRPNLKVTLNFMTAYVEFDYLPGGTWKYARKMMQAKVGKIASMYPNSATEIWLLRVPSKRDYWHETHWFIRLILITIWTYMENKRCRNLLRNCSHGADHLTVFVISNIY